MMPKRRAEILTWVFGSDSRRRKIGETVEGGDFVDDRGSKSRFFDYASKVMIYLVACGSMFSLIDRSF